MLRLLETVCLSLYLLASILISSYLELEIQTQYREAYTVTDFPCRVSFLLGKEWCDFSRGLLYLSSSVPIMVFSTSLVPS